MGIADMEARRYRSWLSEQRSSREGAAMPPQIGFLEMIDDWPLPAADASASGSTRAQALPPEPSPESLPGPPSVAPRLPGSRAGEFADVRTHGVMWQLDHLFESPSPMPRSRAEELPDGSVPGASSSAQADTGCAEEVPERGKQDLEANDMGPSHTAPADAIRMEEVPEGRKHGVEANDMMARIAVASRRPRVHAFEQRLQGAQHGATYGNLPGGGGRVEGRRPGKRLAAYAATEVVSSAWGRK